MNKKQKEEGCFHLSWMKIEEIKSQQFKRLAFYIPFMKGAFHMLLALEDYFDEDRKKDPYLDAFFKMMEKHENREKFLNHNYDEVRFRNFVKNKAGKIISCEAFLAKQTLEFIEA